MEAAHESNGFDGSDPDITIVTERRGSQGFFVRIESKGETYFGKVVLDEIDIARYAAAEYITPVPLGNPGSSLGAGLDAPPIAGDPAERMVLALNSYCQGYNNGDPFGAGFLGTNTCSGTVNNRYPTNPADRGYYFVLDFSGPDDQNNPVTGDWDLQIWEPGLCGQLSEGNTTTGAAMETTLWAGDDTLLTDDDNLVDSNRWPNAVNGGTGPYEWPRNTCGGSPPRDPWITAYEIDADLHQGRWLLRTRTLQRTSESSLNSFGLRLVPRGGNAVCGSIAPSTTCPQVYADTWLPIFIPRWINDVNNNQVTTFAAAQTATFYLADIPEVHANKVLEVKLFDPGEGMDNMQILAPDGTRYPFQRATLNPNAVAPSGFVANSNTCTPPSAAFTDPDTVLGNSYECLDVTGSVYNGVEVIIRVSIPTDYDVPRVRRGEELLVAGPLRT